MIIVDTNVVSEAMKQRPNDSVIRWLDAQPDETLFITAITAAELLFGVARLPAGARRTELATRIASVLDEDFASKVLPFDAAAAVEYAAVTSDGERRGRRISMADAQIAAIARVAGASLATRNVADFIGTGLDLIDPFAA